MDNDDLIDITCWRCKQLLLSIYQAVPGLMVACTCQAWVTIPEVKAGPKVRETYYTPTPAPE